MNRLARRSLGPKSLIQLVLFFFGLPSTVVAAPVDPEQAFLQSDWIADEYSQDLSQAVVKQAMQLASERSPGPRLAWAQLYAGRVHRLRGSYDEAEKLVNLAANSGEPLVQAYAISEQRLLAVDRYLTPWGSLNPQDPDLLCQQPEFPLAPLNYLADVVTALERVQHLPAQVLSRPLQMVHIVELVQMNGQSVEMGTAIRLMARGVKLPETVKKKDILQPLDHTLAELTKSGMFPADRLQRLSRRLLPPLLQRLDNVDLKDFAAITQVKQSVACDRSKYDPKHVPSPDIALLCAELQLFPGGTPDDLGQSLHVGVVADTRNQADATMWYGGDRFMVWRQQRQPAGEDWLTTARQGFTARGNQRGLARVEFVAGADLLAGELLTVQTQARAVLRSDRVLKNAQALAQAAGDQRLVRRIGALLAIGHALRLDRPQAQQAIGALLAAAREAPGEANGIGQLYDGIARVLTFNQRDPSAAEILSDLALQLYHSMPISEGFARYQRAEGLYSVGDLDGVFQQMEGAWSAITSGAKPCSNPNEQCRPMLTCKNPDMFIAEMASLAFQLTTTGSSRAYDARDISEITKWNQRSHDVEAWIGGPGKEPLIQKMAAWQAKERAISDRWNACMGPRPQPYNSAAAIQRRRDCYEVARQMLVGKGHAGMIETLVMREIEGSNLDHEYMEQHVRGLREIEENPDLQPEKRMLGALAVVEKESGTSAIIHRVILLVARGQVAEATRYWLASKDQMLRVQSSELAGLHEFLSQQKQQGQLETMARIEIRLGLFSAARERLAKIEELLKDKEWYLTRQEPWDSMAIYVTAESGLGNHITALAMARKMLDMLELRRGMLADGRLRTSFLAPDKVRSTYEEAVDAAARAHDPALTLQFIERAKARAFQDHLVQTEQALPLRKRLAAIEQALPAVASEARACSPATCSRFKERQELLQREYEKLLQRIGGGAMSQPVPDAETLTRRLGPGTVLLDYFLSQESLHMVILAAGHEPRQATVPILHQTLIKGRVNKLRQFLGLRRALNDSTIEHQAKELGALLFSAPEVQAVLADPEVHELVLAPHRMLHQVPFAMLPFHKEAFDKKTPDTKETPGTKAADKEVLVNRFTLRLLPVASLPPHDRAGAPLPLAAKVLFFQGDDESNEPLRTDREDIGAISKLYGGRPTLDTDRQALVSALQHSKVVHLVSHGAAGPERSHYARLDLKRKPCRTSPPGQTAGCDDGDFTTSDLLTSDFQAASHLVFLDACDVGLGQNTNGDELLGFPRALLQKGVRTVIAALWPLVDRAESTFAVEFHHKYRNEKKSAAVALAEVQRAQLAHEPPGVWAGFTVLGWE